MSHFKFVSTINAAEEGCTHFLVLGNRRLRLGHTGFEKGQHIEASPPFAPGERAEGRPRQGAAQRGVLSHRSKGFQPQQHRDRLGEEEGERGRTGEARGAKWCQAAPPAGGTTGTSQPPHGAETLEGAAGGQRGDPRADPGTLPLTAGAGWHPGRSPGASHRRDVLVTDTSVLCSSVCGK